MPRPMPSRLNPPTCSMLLRHSGFSIRVCIQIFLVLLLLLLLLQSHHHQHHHHHKRLEYMMHGSEEEGCESRGEYPMDPPIRHTSKATTHESGAA